MKTSAPVCFSRDELWFLQSVVRHEMQNQGEWKFPPVSLDLNDQISDALLVIDESDVAEMWLTITRGDCLLIDMVVNQSATSPLGDKVGRRILLKSFAARRALRDEELLDAEEPKNMPTLNEIDTMLEGWTYKAARRRRK